MAFTYITLTRTYKTPAGYPAQGSISFIPVVPMVNGNTVISSQEQASLNSTGSISIPLAANNDPGTTPIGTTYRVQEELTGQPARAYNVVIPYNAPGGTVDLATLAPVTASPPAVSYVSSINGQTGAVTISAGTDATTTSKGAARILGGTADAPTVPWSALTGVDADLTALAGLGDGIPSRSGAVWSARSASQLRTDISAQPSATMLTRLSATPVTSTTSGSVTPDASQACAFFYTATGNLTISDISNGIDGQLVYIQVTASGAARTLIVTGLFSRVLPSGERWAGHFRYDNGLSGFVYI